MSVFQQCWKNWSTRGCLGAPDPSDHAWLNELNQAVFSALEKNLPGWVKVRTAPAPSFVYHTEAAGGYGVDTHSGRVVTHRVVLPEGTFEERVDAAVDQLEKTIVRSGVGTVFLYTTLFPLGEMNFDGTKNTRHMAIRLATAGETVDVEG